MKKKKKAMFHSADSQCRDLIFHFDVITWWNEEFCYYRLRLRVEKDRGAGRSRARPRDQGA